MSRNGGYAIMDLSMYSFTSTSLEEVRVDSSIFDITQRTKPVLISGLTLDNILLPDFYALFTSATAAGHTAAESQVTTRTHTYNITITHNNSTNITTMAVS